MTLGRPLALILPLLLPAVPAFAQAPPKENPDRSPLAQDGHPLAGFHNGLVYLRDPHDNFRVFVGGRLQVDGYAYAGPGVGDSTLEPTFLLRRFRVELAGELFKDFFFTAQGDFGQTAADNAQGTVETSAAAPGAAPTANSGRYASAQTPRFTAQPADAFIGWRGPDNLLNVKLGQYNAPFMLENFTSNKAIPFLERSLTVRTVGIPTNKEIGAMAWGQTKNKLVFYSAGIFNGEGQNRVNLDGRPELMGRVFVQPLFFLKKTELKDAQIGFSLRWGSRDQKSVHYDYPQMTTPGGWAYWTPIYRGAGGFTRVIPSGDQLAVACEVRVPYKRFDLTGELVYIDNNTRESLEGFQATNTERVGTLTGVAGYVQLAAWPIGKRDLPGVPGYQNPPHLDFGKADAADPPHALQLVGRYELVSLSYDSARRGGVADPNSVDGNIRVHSVQLGANYWMTKHVRLSFVYGLYFFPDSAPTTPTAMGGSTWSRQQRALAPGNALAAGVDDPARDGGHDLHEFSIRTGFQF